MINHVLLEVYCHIPENELPPAFCKCPGSPKYECLLEKCPYASFTSHENAICYIGDDSSAEEIISFGGEMIPDSADETEAIARWKQICKRKLDEAYQEYMNQ